MSATGRAVETAPRSRVAQVGWNVRGALVRLFRKPRRKLAWPSRGRVLIGAVVAILAILAIMTWVDPWTLARVRSQPASVVAFFRRATDLGLSGWFLWPTGVALVVLALLDRSGLPRMARGVMAALAVRLGFVFLAIGLPGVFINAVKHIIGRARPFVVDHDVWAYKPFVWPAAYASMPSGHSTTVFSAVVAIGSLWPRMRPVMWLYAALIAASRISIWAHHPSDVLAGAIVGTVGALLVRRWFACRSLAFVIDADGRAWALPGPSFTRIKRVAARLAAA